MSPAGYVVGVYAIIGRRSTVSATIRVQNEPREQRKESCTHPSAKKLFGWLVEALGCSCVGEWIWCRAGTDLEEGMVRSESTRDGRSRSDIRLGPKR